MEIQGHFTRKGLALLAKLSAGATLTITRIMAGSGHTANPLSATALPSICQKLAVNTIRQNENTATIPATLTAAQASSSYTLTELGVYAEDPEDGEILYKLYQLTEPVDITPGSRMVLRFYLEETVFESSDMTVICSPAGLITEEDFLPIRNRVSALGAASATYTMDAGDVQAFLDGLPCLLTENITLFINGSLDDMLTVKGFYGCGSLRIQAAESGGCTLNGGLRIEQCCIPVRLIYLSFTAPSGSTDSSLLVNDAIRVTMESCTFTGNTANKAITANGNTAIIASDCTFTGFDTVALVCLGACVTINCTKADDCSDNRYGAYVWHGGIVLLGGATPALLGAGSHCHAGGIIAKVDGTLI